MNKHFVFVGTLFMSSLPHFALAADPALTPTLSVESGFYTSTELQWKDSPALPLGAKLSVLEGDPSKDGPFVMRVRLPDGFHIPPHTHPKTERVTVLSGTFHLAMGDRLERSATRPLPAGSFGYWPAGMKHTAWAEGETTIQLHGIGPWVINYVNPEDDPRNKE